MTNQMHPSAAARIVERNFRVLWSALNRTYAKHPHAFELGCGRETMSYWVRDATGTQFRPSELRWALNEAYYRGWTDRIKEPGHTTRYTMKKTGRPSPREQWNAKTKKADAALAPIILNGGALSPDMLARFGRLMAEPPSLLAGITVEIHPDMPEDKIALVNCTHCMDYGLVHLGPNMDLCPAVGCTARNKWVNTGSGWVKRERIG